MGYKDLINKSYKDYLEVLEMQQSDNYSDCLENKYAWLSNYFFNITTYDGDLDYEFGKDIYEVMIQIFNRTSFEYIRDETKYKKFILVCNLLLQYKLLEWGTSIRGCWFDYYNSEKICMHGVEDELKLNEEILSYILLEFM